jgi:hypothetical protein
MRSTWEPAWLESDADESAQPLESSAVVADSGERAPDSTIDRAADYSEFCWSQLLPGDYRYLTAARVSPLPCPWCGGRLVHNRLCDALRRSWEPTLRFGKHAGKRLSEVPRDYLEWLAAAGGIDSELSDAIRFHLQDGGDGT